MPGFKFTSPGSNRINLKYDPYLFKLTLDVASWKSCFRNIFFSISSKVQNVLPINPIQDGGQKGLPYKFFRLDHNCNGGGILLYIREDIPSKLLSIERNLTEAFFVEINLHNKKKG